jgi:Mrp family chromosome partitioning ATPase
VHNSFRLPNDAGTADVLRGEAPLEDCMQYVQVQSAGAGGEPERGLYVLTAGAATGDAAELIGSERTPRLLDVLAEQADIVLIDSPPVIGFADSLILGRLATGVILVVEARKTPVPVVLEAKDALIRNQARILGVVISKMEPRDAAQLEGYNYGSSYSFAHAERL